MGDPFSGLANLVIGLIRTHRLHAWVRLCFSLTWSYCTAFSFATGSALIAHQPVATAIGSGMVLGASAACFLFVRSPLTRGLMVSVPKDLILEGATHNELVTMKRD